MKPFSIPLTQYESHLPHAKPRQRQRCEHLWKPLGANSFRYKTLIEKTPTEVCILNFFHGSPSADTMVYIWWLVLNQSHHLKLFTMFWTFLETCLFTFKLKYLIAIDHEIVICISEGCLQFWPRDWFVRRHF